MGIKIKSDPDNPFTAYPSGSIMISGSTYSNIIIYSPEMAKVSQVTIAVQVNGKLRDTISVERDLPEAVVTETAMKSRR